MLHEPAVELQEDKSSKAKSKLGIKLFFVYFIIYSGFVALAVAFPELLGKKIIFGLNLAITYGFSLILLAIIMGYIYHLVCSRLEDKLNAEEGLS